MSHRPTALGLAFATLILAHAAFHPTVARAESGLGWHGGFMLEPDQVVLGAQASFPIGEKMLYFVPQADFGFFNGTSFNVHADMQARLGGEDNGIRPFVGVGGTWFGFDPEGDTDSDSKFGVNVVAGLWTQKTTGKKSFAEVMFFLDEDLPDFRLVIGRNF